MALLSAQSASLQSGGGQGQNQDPLDTIWNNPSVLGSNTGSMPNNDPNWTSGGAFNVGYQQGLVNLGGAMPQGDPYYQQGFLAGQAAGKLSSGSGKALTNLIPPDTDQANQSQAQALDEIDIAINQGMEALNQYQSTIQPSADLQVREAETTAGQQTADTQAEEAARMGELGGQRTSAETKTGSAVAEARRMASQLQQGIQAKYGGSTHMGGAVSEVLGSQATANISQNRAALQETLGKITQAEEQVKRAAQNMITKIDQNLALAKEKAQNWVREAMSQVNSQKATLAGDKAKLRMEVIMHYQDIIQNLNETWRQEQNTIMQKAQQAGTQLAQWQQSMLPQYDPNTQQFTAQGINLGDSGQKAYYTPTIKGYTTNKVSGEDDELNNPYLSK